MDRRYDNSGPPGEVAIDDDLVPVLRPKLPVAAKIVKYLQRIDDARIYSNFGPLACEFQRRIAESLHVRDEQFVAASSGTTALIAAILATAGSADRKRPLAIVPSFTFVATAIAVERCGFEPLLADVAYEDWTLDPEQLKRLPNLDRVGLVVPVAPFGRPVAQAEWIAFSQSTGIPVVMDAAASFAHLCGSQSQQLIGSIPAVLSFHATKSFGIGEGGGVVSTDAELIERVGRALNFGFMNSRISAVPSINGKLSEYHAAVGLAALDEWEQRRTILESVADTYRRHFTSAGVADRFFGAPIVDGCYALFLCGTPGQAAAVEVSLKLARVDFRFWYGSGAHTHPQFAGSPRTDLAVTESLGKCLFGLPMAHDLSADAIARVVGAIFGGLRATKRIDAVTGGGII